MAMPFCPWGNTNPDCRGISKPFKSFRALTEGAAKYCPHNWKHGDRDFFLDAWNHAFVHLERFKEGDLSEDHLAHLACNVAFVVWAVKNRIISQEDSEDFDRAIAHHPPA